MPGVGLTRQEREAYNKALDAWFHCNNSPPGSLKHFKDSLFFVWDYPVGSDGWNEGARNMGILLGIVLIAILASKWLRRRKTSVPA
jgi:hypothetical protein